MMCEKTICAVLLVSALTHAQALADELMGFSDVTVEDGAIVSRRYEGVA